MACKKLLKMLDKQERSTTTLQVEEDTCGKAGILLPMSEEATADGGLGDGGERTWEAWDWKLGC